MSNLESIRKILALAVSIVTFSALPAHAVPSFSRQTGLACGACHTAYPGLNAFGRQFKLNGYTMSGLPQVEIPPSQSAPGMSINKIPNLSVVVQADEEYTTKKADPAANNSHWDATFPKELGVYYAGRITDHLGTFMQLTYAQGAGVSIDMSDMRYVRQFSLAGKPVVWGVDLNNMPTIEDLWNSTNAYGWPYVEGAMTPMPFLADDSVMTNVLGLGTYLYWNDLVYGYFGGYQATPQGGNPAIRSFAPYYRVAFTPTPNLEIGSFGFFAPRPCYAGPDPMADTPLAPSGDLRAGCSGGQVDDLGADLQYQWYPDANDVFTFHARYIHETQFGLQRTFGNGYGGPDSVHSNYVNADVNWIFRHRYGFSGGMFYVWGPQSAFYSAVFGSDMFRPMSTPDTLGEILQFDYYPWENVRLSLQYTLFNRLNGVGHDYNGHGRNASDNNLLVINGLWGF